MMFTKKSKYLDYNSLCFSGHQQIVDRNGADALIKKGAYLGDWESVDLKKNNRVTVAPTMNNSFAAFPNPSSGQIQFSVVAEETSPVRQHTR